MVTGQLSASSAADNQLFMSIPIEVKPAYTRSELAQAARQQRLTLEIVEGLLVVDLLDEVTGVLEQRRSVGAGERRSVGSE